MFHHTRSRGSLSIDALSHVNEPTHILSGSSHRGMGLAGTGISPVSSIKIDPNSVRILAQSYLWSAGRGIVTQGVFVLWNVGREVWAAPRDYNELSAELERELVGVRVPRTHSLKRAGHDGELD